jgi:galactonate dehydratase
VVVDGYFALPTGPGLGLTVDEEVIRAHPEQKVHFNLFKDDWHKRKALLK